MNIGDKVKIIKGPFTNEIGIVSDIKNNLYQVKMANTKVYFDLDELQYHYIMVKITKGEYTGSLGIITKSLEFNNKYWYDIKLNTVCYNGTYTQGPLNLTVPGDWYELVTKSKPSNSNVNYQSTYFLNKLKELWA